jgi:hypothetical protein
MDDARALVLRGRGGERNATTLMLQLSGASTLGHAGRLAALAAQQAATLAGRACISKLIEAAKIKLQTEECSDSSQEEAVQ